MKYIQATLTSDPKDKLAIVPGVGGGESAYSCAEREAEENL